MHFVVSRFGFRDSHSDENEKRNAKPKRETETRNQKLQITTETSYHANT
jgi:hypothetical protein